MCEDSKTVFKNSKKNKFILDQIWIKYVYIYRNMSSTPIRVPKLAHNDVKGFVLTGNVAQQMTGRKREPLICTLSQSYTF